MKRIDMRLKEAINKISGLRYIVGKLELQSAVGRSCLLELPWLESREVIVGELEKTARLIGVLKEDKTLFAGLRSQLGRIKDIGGTVRRLGTKVVLDDLELFELKCFALSVKEIRRFVSVCPVVEVPDLSEVVRLLDPEGTEIPHFYIYDAYSAELAELRAEIRRRKQGGEEGEPVEELYFQSVEFEDRIRERLSGELEKFRESIGQALENVAYLDVLSAKADLALQAGFCRPEIDALHAGTYTEYEGLFHPEVREVLREEGKNFQAVDIAVKPGVTLITGANMAGKSVLLKSLALAQALAQFGFYLPAVKARIVPVEEIWTSMGDGQDELKGLSSFAAEMLCVDRIIRTVKAGRYVLVLLDELARTTNPSEGKAIVGGVAGVLSEFRIPALITTHYSGIEAECRRLRVKGFREDRLTGPLTLKNISDCIDYSLVEEKGGEVPQEALRIAEMLGVDRELTERAKKVKMKK